MMKLHSLVQETNHKGRITEKQISDLTGCHKKGLFLRPDDYRSDVEFKRELADKFLDMGGKIDLIFDDRQCVVDMWRDEGFVVVQVADFRFLMKQLCTIT